MDVPEQRSIISGIGISRVGRRLGVPAVELTTSAARAAIADAGLAAQDVDGIATMGDTPVAEAAAALGIAPSYTGGGIDTGGLLSPLMSAFLAVAEGRARHVLVYRTVQMMGGTLLPPAGGDQAATSAGPSPGGRGVRSAGTPGGGGAEGSPRASIRGGGAGSAGASPSGGAGSSPPASTRGGGAGPAGSSASGGGDGLAAAVMGDMAPLLAAHAYSAANWLALHCQRHMHLYGTTKEQLGALAVKSRANAARNPLAAYREPMTLDDYLGARPVSSPFGLYDCDVPVDGSIAVVVSAEDHAPDCPNRPIRVAAMGGARGEGGWTQRPDFPKMASVEAAAEMWGRTDLRPTDVDVAELYDGFTFLTLAWLEALGLCDDGGSGPFVEGGTRIALDGELPLNTYGGQLSAGRMHGYWVLHEACLQLRGHAGDRQVPRQPEVAVISAGGGPIAASILLTR